MMDQIETVRCPGCEKSIPITASRCRCGWASEKASVRWVDCAFDTCRTRAIVRHRTPAGWANLCERHAMEINQERADDYCEALGLKTIAQKREWLRQNKPTIKRVPRNDEELAA